MTNMGMFVLCGAHESSQQGESVLCLLDQCLETCCNRAEGPVAVGSAQQFGVMVSSSTVRFLPPNMTAWLQPLDLVVCGLIKTLQLARRGWHLTRDLKAWKQKQDQIIGAALRAKKTPPPLEP
jgi:hypothetical protein